MANQSSSCPPPPPNPTQNHTNKPTSSFLGRSLSDVGTIITSWGRLHDIETITSPNFILDGMQNLNVGNFFGYDRKSPNPITKNPPNIKTIPNNTPHFQTSRGRLDGTESITSPNSILDGMQNHNLGNPFGYDRKPPNPITKPPSNNKLESETIKTSQGRSYDAEVVTSPNSFLDGIQNHNLGNPVSYDRKSPNPITKKHPNNKLESESIGLALIDPKETSGSSSKDYNRSMVLFGAKLKAEVKNTCGDFGEMESSEDYTCVITYGPNPKTTHIFDNCIVESCCGVRKLSELTREKSCKVDHTEGKDIYNG